LEVIGVELAIIIGCVLTLLAIERVITTHTTTKSRVLIARATKPPARQAIGTESIIGDSSRVAVTHDDSERALTARLLAGELHPATYRSGMAALAATEQRVSGVSPLRSPAADRHSQELLGTAMPGLPQATLFAAVALAHTGATVEDLTRLLELTTAQSLRVVVTTTGNADHQT
jgi:hypothetical protein